MAVDIGDQYQQGWSIIQGGVDHVKAIVYGTSDIPMNAMEYMKIKGQIEQLSQLNSSNDEQLYSGFQSLLQNHLNQKAIEVQDLDGCNLLDRVRSEWKIYLKILQWMIICFKRLDQSYVPFRPVQSLKIAGKKLFKDRLFDLVNNKLRDAALEVILTARKGADESTAQIKVVKEVIELYVEMGLGSLIVYQYDFQQKYLQQTELYYKQQVQDVLHDRNASVKEYAHYAKTTINTELKKATGYIHHTTTDGLQARLANVLIAQQISKLLESTEQFLDNEEYEALADVFNLLLRVKEQTNALHDLSQQFGAWIKAQGMQTVQSASFELTNAEGQQQFKEVRRTQMQLYCSSLIELLNKTRRYLKCFGGLPQFQTDRREALQSILDIKLADKYRAQEILAIYVDQKIRQHQARKADDEQTDAVGDHLRSAVQLSESLPDQDDFQSQLAKYLKARLMQDRDPSELERELITSLAQTYSYNYVQKMQSMLLDMENTREFTSQFKSHTMDGCNVQCAAAVKGLNKLQVTVLTKQNWDKVFAVKCTLPQQLQAITASFETWYANVKCKSNMRKLQWLHADSHCTLSTLWLKKNIQISCFTVQAAILMLFNNEPSLSFEDIVAALGCMVEKYSRDQNRQNTILVGRALGGLCVPTPRSGPILVQTPTSDTQGKLQKVAEYCDNVYQMLSKGEFQVNEDLAKKGGRVAAQVSFKLLPYRSSEQNDERELLQGREIRLETYMVRIGKSRKSVSRDEMFTEVAKSIQDSKGVLFKLERPTFDKVLSKLVRLQYFKVVEDLFIYIP